MFFVVVNWNIFFWSFSNAVVALKHFIISSFASTDSCFGRPWCFFIWKESKSWEIRLFTWTIMKICVLSSPGLSLRWWSAVALWLKGKWCSCHHASEDWCAHYWGRVGWDHSGTSWMLVAMCDFKVDDAYKKDMERVQLGCFVEIWPVLDLH